MHTKKTVSSVLTLALLVALASAVLCASVYAQQPPPPGEPGAAQDRPRGGGGGGGGFGRMSPEQNAAGWQAQATIVAEDLGLSPELTAKLVDAYKTNREGQMAAMEALRKEAGEDQRPDREKMQAALKAEGAKLEPAVKAFLNPEQTAKVMATLSSSAMRWQNMAVALQEMKLESKVKAQAVKLVLAYVVEFDKAMQGAGQGDREAIRTSLRTLKEKLDADMAKILTPEQSTKWNESTAMMRAGGMRRGPGGQGGPGGPGGGDR